MFFFQKSIEIAASISRALNYRHILSGQFGGTRVEEGFEMAQRKKNGIGREQDRNLGNSPQRKHVPRVVTKRDRLRDDEKEANFLQKRRGKDPGIAV